MNRCANNYWYYCIGEPEFETEPEERVLKEGIEETFSSGGHCKKNWRECEYCKGLTELTADKLDLLPTPAPRLAKEDKSDAPKPAKSTRKVKTLKETMF